MKLGHHFLFFSATFLWMETLGEKVIIFKRRIHSIPPRQFIERPTAHVRPEYYSRGSKGDGHSDSQPSQRRGGFFFHRERNQDFPSDSLSRDDTDDESHRKSSSPFRFEKQGGDFTILSNVVVEDPARRNFIGEDATTAPETTARTSPATTTTIRTTTTSTTPAPTTTTERFIKDQSSVQPRVEKRQNELNFTATSFPDFSSNITIKATTDWPWLSPNFDPDFDSIDHIEPKLPGFTQQPENQFFFGPQNSRNGSPDNFNGLGPQGVNTFSDGPLSFLDSPSGTSFPGDAFGPNFGPTSPGFGSLDDIHGPDRLIPLDESHPEKHHTTGPQGGFHPHSKSPLPTGPHIDHHSHGDFESNDVPHGKHGHSCHHGHQHHSGKHSKGPHGGPHHSVPPPFPAGPHGTPHHHRRHHAPKHHHTHGGHFQGHDIPHGKHSCSNGHKHRPRHHHHRSNHHHHHHHDHDLEHGPPYAQGGEIVYTGFKEPSRKGGGKSGGRFIGYRTGRTTYYFFTRN